VAGILTTVKMKSLIKYFFLALVAGFCIYSFLNSFTLFVWGDPSVHGEPRLFHPPEILILHYTSLISPVLGRLVVPLFIFISGLGFLYLGFRHVTARNSLQNPVRNTIVSYVRDHPGHHFSTIMRETGINRGTLSYHLWQLKTVGMIHEVKDGGLTRYFIHTNGILPLKQKLLVHQDNPVRDRIIQALKTSGKIPREYFIKELGISGPLLWYHIRLLVKDGIVRVEQIDRRTSYVLSDEVTEILKPELPENRFVPEPSRTGSPGTEGTPAPVHSN